MTNSHPCCISKILSVWEILISRHIYRLAKPAAQDIQWTSKLQSHLFTVLFSASSSDQILALQGILQTSKSSTTYPWENDKFQSFPWFQPSSQILRTFLTSERSLSPDTSATHPAVLTLLHKDLPKLACVTQFPGPKSSTQGCNAPAKHQFSNTTQRHAIEAQLQPVHSTI